MNKIDRCGESKLNDFGTKMTIIEYKDIHNIVVKFEDGYITEAQYRQFKKGNLKSKNEKRFYNIGFLGVGKYETKINGKFTKQYSQWSGMLTRCYNNKLHKEHMTYENCSVCEEWLNFQNFAKWFDENYYEVDNEVMNLDKDILIKGNKVYCPSTCIFVPQNINKLFCKADASRGNLPIGVTYHERDHIFEVKCCGINKRTYLGRFNNSNEAFLHYKEYKESVIKEIAKSYKNKIPKKLYSALYMYKVETTD
ncbi:MULTISPECIES: hypothetical protein [unclassified Clostridium]|uniref:hypothetical protein n=1 Tax=unclassified Clostridium TaxID=2614128 RepID=UPI0020799CD9|nr:MULTISPECIES: hypothetical protein [unclassified Clostridium]